MKFWRRVLPVLMGGLLWAAAPARAVEDCPGCLLGIWDDDQLARNYGYSTPGVIKIVYVGFRAADPQALFNNVEFSIAGLRPENDMFVVAVSCAQGGIPSCIGPIASPADTSATSAGTGGLVTTWFDCFSDGQPLIAVALVHFGPKADHVLQVTRKYPTSDPAWRTPVAFQCTTARVPVRVRGGCYVLNPTPGVGGPCALEDVATAHSSWSRVKSLYRR